MPFMIRFSMPDGGGEERVVFGPFNTVRFQGEHLCLAAADMALLRQQYPSPELWDDTDYPPNCLASAQQSGMWWVQPIINHFELMEIYSPEDSFTNKAVVAYDGSTGPTLHFEIKRVA